MLTPQVKVKVQNFGRFLSNMVMPNIGAFIAWGLITALFIPTGWFPNKTLAALVGPMITYLLPLLIGYTGGRLLGGDRGGVVGAITTMGVIIGSDIPMFLGAMIAGPLGGWSIKHVDRFFEGKIKSGFEMLVNNFSAGITGMILAIVTFYIVGPAVTWLSEALKVGVNFLVQNDLLPLTSVFVEPGKILFLNNAINHGIFTPIGTQQALTDGLSPLFLIEANPGPGMGILMAYIIFGRGTAKLSAPGAAIIHFFGGIHEIYFPYVLMNPRLLLAVILGGMSGVFTLTLFNAGLQAPASPGSIFAVLLMTPKPALIGVILDVIVSFTVTFLIASVLVRNHRSEIDEGDSLADAQARTQQMKTESKGSSAATTTVRTQINSIIVACDAGMGSSAMGAGMLHRKLEQAGLGHISCVNKAINDLDGLPVDLVITHQDLTERAKQHAPDAEHLSLTNFLDGAFYSALVQRLQEQQGDATSTTTTAPAQAGETDESLTESGFSLSIDNIAVGLASESKEEAIRRVGEMLVAAGYAEPPYIDAMFEREQQVTTYLGNGVAVPHGTNEAKGAVIKTGVVICQYPQGVQFGDDPEDKAKLLIGIAAKSDEHLTVLSNLAGVLEDKVALTRLTTKPDAEYIRDRLTMSL